MEPEEYPKLGFLGAFGAQEAYEAEARGYLSQAVAVVSPSHVVPLVFYDTTRLEQDLADEVAGGIGYIAGPGLIVVSEVTVAEIAAAIRRLQLEGFFNAFKPRPIGAGETIHPIPG